CARVMGTYLKYFDFW
nr:immunoglobulin heavy chain junction region [Macaca mulatta]MOX38032.1 immunoglobulin heavy chain junction region [Macaca mulatta]MOX38876.1 immunoglobulin heavy chain junction region [Macaca mulatta]MOX39200.1 immunoglobulin heavy chain junction region [Macaca mulatta]MOX39383.1 immunoglobulin heavy chain junction region [Macaca mulatta]